MTIFSERSELLAADAIARAAAARRARGEPILDLTATGAPDARAAFACLAALFCDPHDEILVPTPGAALLDGLDALLGIHLAREPLRRLDRGWTLEPAALYDAITERTRAILIASPDPATGAVLDDDAIEAIAALGLPWIADQRLVDRPLDCDAIPRVLAGDAAVPTFVVDGQGRIAIGGPAAEIDGAEERLLSIAATLGAPLELASLTPDASRATAPDARRNLARLRELARGSRMTIPRIEGGTAACVRMPRDHRGADAWGRALLDEHGVRVTSGAALGFPDEEAWLVVGLLAPEAAFDEAARALARLA